LLGNQCEVFTDHKSLKYICSPLNLNLRQTRWMETIKDFDLSIN
jgi:RNase H-like domain found in reverse transcriptase